MTVCRKQMAVFILLVIELEVIDTGLCKKVISCIHLYAEGMKNLLRLLRLLDDCILLLLLFVSRHRKDGKIMLEERII